MKYLLFLLMVGCASVKSVKQPFVDIGIDGQPQIIHTLDSASEPVTNMIGAGDALGLQTYEEIESSKKVMDPWLYLDGFLRY
tara:strand:+ start:414 stop:659 length:246 start_codon:yes stop_codon:yes gene_type:complete